MVGWHPESSIPQKESACGIMLIIVKTSKMIHHAFLRNQDERTNTMPSMYDIFDITSLEKKLIELISSSSI